MRQTLKDVVVTGLVAIMAASCAGRQDDTLTPSLTGGQPISGTWATTGIGPVYRESMTLAQSGSHVTGTGQYALEAGRQGPTTIKGDWSNGTLSLTITRDYGLSERFTGTLSDATHLSGALEIDGNKQELELAKR
jgi:hypothetical protein